ncbi:MAG: DNA-3-methyladenine glycosylase [Kiritimatiellia bacterium]|jgi:DNA-3-methyladenine glycosylase|nr:DNA-3-methyladenine glycosylase [Kiritimatiellia bacterium]MDP6809164.1 DNA-3-methyladenine glycosylase [Kiritimatiellia bacterium]
MPREFYGRPTLDVAPELLGKVLVHRVGDIEMAGRVIEVEAYLGPEDLASHAARKTSKRARIMFGPPGMVYIYLIYGMHHCLNFVTEKDGTAGAVLVRAVEPIAEIEHMRLNRAPTVSDHNLANGPGKLCQAMAIDLTHNRTDACSDTIWLEDRGGVTGPIRQTPRIGVDYAGQWAEKLWRFTIDEEGEQE